MTADEAEERLLAGWSVNDCDLEAAEFDDYGSPQRKRWLYQVRKDQLHSLMKAHRDQR